MGTVFVNLSWYQRTKDLVPLFDPIVHLFAYKMLAQLLCLCYLLCLSVPPISDVHCLSFYLPLFFSAPTRRRSSSLKGSISSLSGFTFLTIYLKWTKSFFFYEFEVIAKRNVANCLILDKKSVHLSSIHLNTSEF